MHQATLVCLRDLLKGKITLFSNITFSSPASGNQNKTTEKQWTYEPKSFCSVCMRMRAYVCVFLVAEKVKFKNINQMWEGKQFLKSLCYKNILKCGKLAQIQKDLDFILDKQGQS